MKHLLIAGMGLAALTGGGVLAQTNDQTAQQEKPEADEARTPSSPEAIKARLQERAQRIPARNLAAALRAARDERSDRAETLKRPPDLGALREELKRTETEDAQRQAAAQNFTAGPNAVQRQSAAEPPAPGIRPVASVRLKSADPKEIERVRLPVLLPADPAIRDKIKVYGMENVYTATATIDSEANLLISGTCNRVVGGDPDVVAFRKRLAEGPPRLAGSNAAYRISRNDFGVDLSFSKFGCGYVMTIECGDPGADPRCAADDYITGLAESMILANPELAGGE